MRLLSPCRRGTLYICLFILIVLLAAADLSAEEIQYHRDLQPHNSRIIASGGVAGLQGGIQSFFHNPAASAADGGGWHIMEASAWGSSSISIPALTDSVLNFDDLLSAVLHQLQENIENTDDGGQSYSAGIMTGFGRSGAGLNLGFFMQFAADSGEFNQISPYSDSRGALDAQISAHIGWTQSFSFENGMLAAGFQVRPMFRIHTEFPDVIPESGIGSLPTLSGSALAVDAGLYGSYHRVRLGLSLRNFIPVPLDYTVNRFSLVSEQLTRHFGLPSSSNIPESSIPGFTSSSYHLPATLGLAAAYSPDLSGFVPFISPTLETEFRFPLHALNIEFLDNPFQYVHLGANVDLYDALRLSGGINQSYYGLGASFRLWKFDLSAAARIPGTWDAPVERGPFLGSFDFGFRL
ncbi:hypothetical protein [Spirochaeta dissipatitropha]